MSSLRKKRGFTLVEMMLAVSLSVMVFAALGIILVRCFSLWKDATANWRLAQYARISRERILHGGFANPAGGLLSATNAVVTNFYGSIPSVVYATDLHYYGIYGYTYLSTPQIYLFDQNSMGFWTAGSVTWRWALRMDQKYPAPDVQVPELSAERNGKILTIEYLLRLSAGGQTYTQPHTIEAYLVNEGK